MSTRTALLEWLSSSRNPPVRYLVARDLLEPRPAPRELARSRQEALEWEPLGSVLALQQEDGSFPEQGRTQTARPTFWALGLMQRCGLDIEDAPVRRAVDYLEERYASTGPIAYRHGASGVLPCYAGVVTTTLIKLGAGRRPMVRESLDWLVAHQRFDDKTASAGGDDTWPYRTPANFGCWESVSCYHGVAGAFRALAAGPRAERTAMQRQRLDEALTYLRHRRLFRKSSSDRPLFRHMLQPFLVGDYRSGLLDMLEGIADADPALAHEPWVADSVAAMEALTADGRVTLAKNYGRSLMDPIPFETIGEPSRFLTYQWLRVRSALTSLPSVVA